MGFDTIWLSKMIDQLKKENKALRADLKAVAVAARTYMRYPLHTAERMALGEALDRPRVKKILKK